MAAIDPYRSDILTASQKYGVPAQLLAAQIQAESNFNPNAKSPAGATGISQFMPGTAKGYGIDPLNPHQSIDAQGKMMSGLLKRFGGNVDKALAGYNAGAGAVEKYGGVPPYKETQNYVKNIKEYEKRFPGLAAGTSVPSKGSVTSPKAPLGVTGIQTPDEMQTAQRQSQLPLITSLLQSAGGGVHNPGLEVLTAFQTAGKSTAPLTGAAPANAPGVDIPLKSKGTAPAQLAGTIAGPKAAQIVGLAQQYLGTPYKWGGSDPKNGFDCSGFVQYIYGKQGIQIPRTTFDQVKAGVGVAKNELQPGDILFFNTAGTNSHEGMYIGNGKFIQAPHTGDVVKISNLSDPYYTKHYSTARRVTGGANAV